MERDESIYQNGFCGEFFYLLVPPFASGQPDTLKDARVERDVSANIYPDGFCDKFFYFLVPPFASGQPGTLKDSRVERH